MHTAEIHPESLSDATHHSRPGVLHRKTFAGFIKSTYSDWSEHKIPRMSAALAYYTVFSLAPILLIAIAIAGFVFGHNTAQGAIVNEIQHLVGRESAQTIAAALQSTQKPGHSGLISTIVGVFLLVLGATGVFGEIQDALNTIWNAQPTSKSGVWVAIKDRFLSFGMVLIIGFLLLVSLVISAGLTKITEYINQSSAILPVLVHLLDVVVSLGVVSVLSG